MATLQPGPGQSPENLNRRPEANSIEDIKRELSKIESATTPVRVAYIRNEMAQIALEQSSGNVVASGNRYKPLNVQEPADQIFQEIDTQHQIIEKILPHSLFFSRVINQINPDSETPISEPTELVAIALQARDIQEKTLEKESVPFFSSHLLLPREFEESFLHYEGKRKYLLSTELPLIDPSKKLALTQNLDLLRSIVNPIAVMVSPDQDIDELLEITDELNPDRYHGKIAYVLKGFNDNEKLPKMRLFIEEIGKLSVKSLVISAPVMSRRFERKTGRNPVALIQREMNAVHQACRLVGTRLHGLFLETSSLEATAENTTHELNNEQLRKVLTKFNEVQQY